MPCAAGRPVAGRPLSARIADLLWTLVPSAAMLIGLPLLGLWLSGGQPARYLEFPPQPEAVPPAPFSRAAFTGLSLLIAGVLAWVVMRAAASYRNSPPAPRPHRRPLPGWGVAAAALGALAWLLAWTRLEWFAPVQPHTFTLLWAAYIVVVNAQCVARSGTSPLTGRARLLGALFPASALFWWFFEYLNRFVGNWIYSGAGLSAWSYFWLATVPFSTVLPAVLSTQALLLSFPGFRRAFGRVRPLPRPNPRLCVWGALVGAAAGLIAIGMWPAGAYPLVWVAPLAVLTGIRSLRGQPHILQDLGTPDWTAPASAALAALVCGFFWEMWNYYSLAQWSYSIPYVDRFPIFEMPLLGYAGYLPFGLVCAAAMAPVEEFFRDGDTAA